MGLTDTVTEVRHGWRRVLANRTVRQALRVLFLGLIIQIVWASLKAGIHFNPSFYVLIAAAWCHGWLKGHR